MKEFLVEDQIAQEGSSYKAWDDLSFGEKARELGANLAHQVYEEVISLVSVAPKLCEEARELSSRYLFDNFSLDLGNENGTPQDNYDYLISQGHKIIDKVFATNQAEQFSDRTRDKDPINLIAVGEMPLPVGIPNIFSSTSKLLEAGSAIDRGGFTKAGRGLMKHGYRDGSAFPKPIGNAKQVNDHGQSVLESIVNHPERQISYKETKNLGKVVDIHAPEIGGVRYNASGEFIGFLEP